MSEWEEDLLALFDTLDEGAQAEALAAALKIIGGEILRKTVPELGTVFPLLVRSAKRAGLPVYSDERLLYIVSVIVFSHTFTFFKDD